jgi:hypothetical protein
VHTITVHTITVHKMSEKVALVFGASGVTGWSFVNEILGDYPKKGVWSKVHALTNRPLSLADSMWPKDDRLNIVSGIDLLKGSQDDLEKELKSKIVGIEKVTHVYYLGTLLEIEGLKGITVDCVNSIQSEQRSTPRAS